MTKSGYQELKLQIVDFLGLSKDAIHIHIGLIIFVFAVAIWKKGKVTPICLVPVLLVAFGMESIDLYDDYNSLGYFHWSNSIHDILNTTIWPILMLVLVKVKLSINNA